MDPSTVAEQGEQTSKETIYLDVFPVEVRERIAFFVCGGRDNLDALSLAEVSESQRLAVFAVLNGALAIDDFELWDYRDFDEPIDSVSNRWVKLYVDDVEKVSITNPQHAFEDNIVELVQSPTLKVACIPECEPLLEALLESRSVKDLCVQLIDGNHDMLLETLEMLELTRLQVCCGFNFRSTSCVSQLLEEVGLEAFASRCPKLTSLQVSCVCMREVCLWPALKTLQSLRELHLSASLPDDALPFLEQLESVKILGNCRDGVVFASRIGHAVTSLVYLDSWELYEENLTALTNCINLAHLTLRLPPGLEVPLASVVSSFPKLRGLCLHWEVPRTGMYEPAEGIVLDMVKGVSKLAELGLWSVRISNRELNKILCNVGPHLRVCGLSIREQCEPEYARLARIMRGLAVFGSCLEDLVVDGCSSVDRIQASEEEKQRRMSILGKARNLLLRSSPTLDVDRLQKGIASAVEWD